MAFRKVRRSFPGRKFATKRALAAKAPKRYDHATAFNTTLCDLFPEFLVSSCGGVEEDPVSNPGRIVLLSDATKEQFYEDSVTVVGVEAHLEFEPNFTFDTQDLLQQFGIRSQWQWQFFGGLRKTQEHFQGSIDPTLPGVDEPIPAPLTHPNDRTDLFWYRKKYQLSRQVDSAKLQLHTISDGMFQGIGSSVTAAGAGAPENTLSNGSGTINIPPITSNPCIVCLADDLFVSGQTSEIPAAVPRVKHNFRTRRRISLKGKEALVYDFEVLVPNAFSSSGPREGNVDVFGWVDLVIET